MADKGSIKSWFSNADSARHQILQRVRRCAAITKPWLLTPLGQTANDELPEPYQSIGARGMTNLEGRMLLALFPPSSPWFRMEIAPDLLYGVNEDDPRVQQTKRMLFLRELQIQATLESASLKRKDNQRRVGFRSRQRMALSQIIGTGDVLQQLTADYRVKVFKRDCYVTKRDAAQDVLYHIIREKIDPLALTDEQKQASGLDIDTLREKKAHERLEDLYTLVEWNPESKVWVITQEINSNEINSSQEEVSPFFATTFELAPGEDYGRGFIELNIGDLQSHDALEEKILDFAAMASKLVPCIDNSSMATPEDLSRPTGEAIRCRVSGGQVQDIALLTVDKASDFNVVAQTSTRKEKALAKAMLLESDIQPQKERVTATQVQRIAMELEGALGGFYAPIAESLQMPLIERTAFQMQQDRLLQPLPDGMVRTDTLTGMAALRREVEKGKLLEAVQLIGQLGPEAQRRIDVGVLTDVILRYSGVYEPGVVKSPDQLAQELQQQMAAQAQAQAAEKAIDVGGNIIEDAAANQTPTRSNAA